MSFSGLNLKPTDVIACVGRLAIADTRSSVVFRCPCCGEVVCDNGY